MSRISILMLPKFDFISSSFWLIFMFSGFPIIGNWLFHSWLYVCVCVYLSPPPHQYAYWRRTSNDCTFFPGSHCGQRGHIVVSYSVQFSHVCRVVGLRNSGKRVATMPFQAVGTACETNGCSEERKWSLRNTKCFSVTGVHEVYVRYDGRETSMQMGKVR